MGKLWRLGLLTYHACMAVQLLLLWSCGSGQVPGFLSIDCGSPSTRSYTDTNNITWTSDADLMTEGEALTVDNTRAAFINTMRLFRGNQSKYCYRLMNSAVQPGAFFLVRALFWRGTHIPKFSNFRFKLLINADGWRDVEIPNNSDKWVFLEIYTRAVRDSIDVCLARSSPDGDDPFISALELRPLPSSLSATRLMATINRNFLLISREDYGFTGRYPSDMLDRFWFRNPTSLFLQTTAPIHISSNDQERLPANVLQTAFGGTQGTSNNISWSFSDMDENGTYYCMIYFAEIDPRVNASGQRVFNIDVNGETKKTDIDVFQAVGGNTSYEVMVWPISATQQASISIELVATSNSLFPPFSSAIELFQANPVSNDSFSTDVTAIDDLKTSMSLHSYIGDPCLPIGFGYSWLTCTNSTSAGDSRIISISLSNRSTGGKIPESINNLTMLNKILLDGNSLEGSIPDMSGLTSLQFLDLSNNKLNGHIPESLARLTKLQVLNLSNNNLTGEVPVSLLQRQRESTLYINFSGNTLCGSSSEVPCTSKSKNKTGLIIGVIIAVLFVVLVTLTLFKLYKNKLHSALKQSFFIEEEESSLYPTMKANPVIMGRVPMLSIREFTFQEIKIATSNFTTQIGRGGFGLVYKGSLENGRNVAIKVSSNSQHQGSKEFLNEVELLSRIHHKSLVGLVGFCNEKKLILVYEFMSSGSLFDRLHGEFARDLPLSWSTRLKILVDAAQGLDYLHYGCNPRIIHRDIKSSNILLNDKLEAKISDFGISRNSFINESGAPPTALMGSMGYLDPEYFSTSREKVDVYSFGVLLFEIVCGRTAIFVDTFEKQTHIVEWIRPYIERGAIDDIIDMALHGSYNLSSIWKVLDVALACVQFSSDKRPNMSIVYLELKEAQSMELESDKSDMFPKPTTTLISKDYESFSLTHVNPR